MRDDTETGFRDFTGNEQTIASKIVDPPKERFASPAGSFGCISGNVLRSDGGQDEKVLLILKPDEYAGGQGGSYEFFAQRPNTVDDANMIKLLTLNTREAIFHVPIRFVTTVPPPPLPIPSPPPPTSGIPEGDFAAIVQVYGFPSDDEQPYREGRLTWAQVLSRMDARRG